MIGIYEITNTATGQMYIGRAVKMEQRLNQHLNALRRQIHTNRHMQRSFDKYGKAAFTFKIMIVCRREDCPFYERLLVAGFNTYDPKIGFNQTVPILDVMAHTDKARAAIGAFQKVYQATNHYLMTDEIREKIAAKLRGVPTGRRGIRFSEEKKAKSGAPKGNKNRLGKTRTDDEKARISAGVKAAQAANPALMEALQRINIGNTYRRGLKATAETSAKISAAKKGQPAHNKGKTSSPETKAKQSMAKRGKTLTPEHRMALSRAQVLRHAKRRSEG